MPRPHIIDRAKANKQAVFPRSIGLSGRPNLLQMMDDGAGYSDPALPETCYCGRTFLQQNALSNHRRSCQTSKKRTSSALDSARDAYSKRKKARTTYILPTNPQDEISMVLPPVNSPLVLVSLIHTSTESSTA